MTKYYEIKVEAYRRKDFDKTIQILKDTAGKFNSESKTWFITAEEGRDAVAELKLYYLGGVDSYLQYMTITEIDELDYELATT